MGIMVKSIYAVRETGEGYKVLVDDYLPDSMDEYKAGVDLWLKNIMPGKGLKNMLDNNPELWEQFKEQYFRELDDEKSCWVEMLARNARDGNVMLYYSSPDPSRNNAVAIRDYIQANTERLGLKAA